MTCEEIFKELSEHMVKGLMIHEQLANYYDFLGLSGYRDCHEYHFIHESMMYRKLNKYYINHYNKLIPEMEFEKVSEIPESWYNHTRSEVDINTKRNAIKEGLTKWVEWEAETKELYSNMYKEIVANGNIAAATFLEDFITDVDCELKQATEYWLTKEAINYDMTVIVGEQKWKSEKYKDKISHIGDKND